MANFLGKSWLVLKSWFLGGGQNRDFNFWRCFAEELNPEIKFHLWGILGRSIIIEKMGGVVILL